MSSTPRFSELVSIDTAPDEPTPADRTPVATDTFANQMGDSTRNSGFISALVDRRRGARLKASRRGFLRSTIAGAAAGTALSVGNLFGPAKRVEAQTGIIGTYPRRILTYCPPYNAGDNCQPGCGSSPICTDCCGSDGYFRNEPANGYTLYPGGCGDGDIADGWLWRYGEVCGNCASIEYRCSDGYVQTDTGPVPFICRWVTFCEPLPEGTEAGPELVDAARPTNWRPAGALELAVDNGGSVTISGWIADSTREPVSMRVTSNGQIVHIGTAALPRADISRSVSGAGPKTGFAVSFPVEPGEYRLCVDALLDRSTATIGCVNLNVGAGASVRGSGATGSIPSTPDENDDDNDPEATPTVSATPTATPVAVLPEEGPASESPTYGAAQIIRRSGPDLGFVSGWAGDVDTDEAAFVEILVDGESVAVVRPDLPRPDVGRAFPELGAMTGFALSVPLPPTEAEVCIDLIGADDGRRRPLGCRTIGAAPEPVEEDDGRLPPSSSGAPDPLPPVIYGAIDTVEVVDGSAVVRGWAFDPDDRTGVVTVGLRVADSEQSVQADLAHEGARLTYGLTGEHGFEAALPLQPGTHLLIITASAASGAELTTLGEQSVVVQ